MEQWKEIKGFEGRYLVSSSARVKTAKGKILTKRCRNDREYVSFQYKKITYRRYIHILMRIYWPTEDYKDFKSKF